MAQKKIVYLFGAGATHAELTNIIPDSNNALFLKKEGLLLKYVSERVIEEGKKGLLRKGSMSSILSPEGLSNIELFISLISTNQLRSEETVIGLKDLLINDIRSVLTPYRVHRFYLTRSLIELHTQVLNQKEDLLGFITLNYDNVLLNAFSDFNLTIDNGFNKSRKESVALLQLHGGFDLKYRGRNLPIITPGINKNYLQLPYNFIWGRALELLMMCNELRVVGCSLSTNDVGMIDLIFKALLSKEKDPFEIQIINHDQDVEADLKSNNETKKYYGFFPKVKSALELENHLITDIAIKDSTNGSNPYKIWLKAKVERAITEKLTTTQVKTTSRYIKKLFV